MKTLSGLWVFIVLVIFSNQITAQTTNYDSVLAKKLKADDYGMKSYVLVILKTGTSTDTTKETMQKVFAGHMANIKKLAAENKLILAGPMGSNDKNYEGIFVFNTADMNEAKQWLATDPAFESKHLDAELYPWYCTASLQEIPMLHEKITKKSF